MDPTDQPPSAPLTFLQRRLLRANADIIDVESDRAEFLHSTLCQVGLPRSKTEARTFERNSGNAGISIEAGKLYQRGRWVDQPLPYGAKPRLVLIHLCSEAVRTKSPTVEVGQSAREFLRRLCLDDSGHEYPRFRAQMEALAACRMTIGFSTDNKDVTISTQPISRFEAWVQHDDKSIGLWPGSMTLSAEFFATLSEHAVPLDGRAIHALQKSALQLDVYCWLAQRLCRVRKAGGVKVSWRNMRDQFGQEYRTPKDFKREMKNALGKVLAVYPDAKVEDVAGGLLLKPSPPPIKRTQEVLVGWRGRYEQR